LSRKNCVSAGLQAILPVGLLPVHLLPHLPDVEPHLALPEKVFLVNASVPLDSVKWSIVRTMPTAAPYCCWCMAVIPIVRLTDCRHSNGAL
jgi:hypothetical protein